jgi:hypothetical protein
MSKEWRYQNEDHSQHLLPLLRSETLSSANTAQIETVPMNKSYAMLLYPRNTTDDIVRELMSKKRFKVLEMVYKL